MNANKVAREIAKQGAPTVQRAAHGQWVDPAEVVYKLVTKKHWNVSDAVREVVKSLDFKDAKHAFNGVRAAYYVIRKTKDEEFAI